jgi:ADP-ribosylglycohydrolase/tetratricopeptide (TPR) repeat protein
LTPPERYPRLDRIRPSAGSPWRRKLSIFDQTNQRRPGPHHALRLFVDRYEPARDFASRLNDEPPRARIAFYAGVGGTGKSALLRHLQSSCCWRLSPEQWSEIRGYPDELLVPSLAKAPSAVEVPVALLDFGARPTGPDRPQEAFGALFMLKRQLAKSGITTPRFDFAAITYMHKLGMDVQQLVGELFPGGELQLAADLADTLLNLPVIRTGMALYEIVNRRLDDVFTRRKLQRRVPPETAAAVLALSPEPDLVDELPRLFAEDLRESLASGRHRRLALLFDTYEAFAGEAVAARRTRVVDLGGPRWFRDLLGHLPLGDGVVVVVAGRTAPRWGEAPVAAIPDAFVDLRALGPIPADFADAYLESTGIADDRMRAALIEYASVEPGQTHPLLLGLVADVALAAAERGAALDPEEFAHAEELAGKERELTARLLAWVTPELEEAMVAVGAARSFDEATFAHLCDRLGLRASRADFPKVVAFSFISRHQPALHAGAPAGPAAPAGEPPGQPRESYEMHRLLRRALERVEPEATRAAHQVLRDYYAEMAAAGDPTARIDEIYHRGRLDPADGVALWRQTMEESLAIGRYDRCRSLIGLLPDLEVPTERDRESTTYLMARAELGLGRLDQVERLLASTPASSPYATLLLADLAFQRGQLELAERRSAEALAAAGSGAARLPFLFRSAELRLYLGGFDEGRRLCQEGLAEAERLGDANQVAAWRNLLGEIEFFSGHADEATTQFAVALSVMDGIDDERRNQPLAASLLQNQALVAEAAGDPEGIRRAQGEALRIRREIGDARGVAHSLNGIAIAAAQLGDAAEATSLFEQAATAARDAGDELLLAKVSRARGELAIKAGRLEEAGALIGEAIEDFQRRGAVYDLAHATITQSALRAAGGNRAAAMALLDRARSMIERGDHHSLYMRCPAAAIPPEGRFEGGVVAYAAGDALGVPWEGRPPSEIDLERVAELPARGGWPRGSTSDDTAQLLLVARCLIDASGRPTRRELLERLDAALPDMRGVGPSTSAAVERFRRTGTVPGEPGADDREWRTAASNGAAMRALPIGWALPASADDRRRELTIELSGATHGAPTALAAACLVAAMAAWSVEDAGAGAVLEAARRELEWLAGAFPEAARELAIVGRAAEGGWRPGPGGVPLDAAKTAAAVVHVLRQHDRPETALPYAVSLGGDTDTVAAIAGGILGCCATGESATLPWLEAVELDGLGDLGAVAAGLRELRRAAYEAGDDVWPGAPGDPARAGGAGGPGGAGGAGEAGGPGGAGGAVGA